MISKDEFEQKAARLNAILIDQGFDKPGIEHFGAAYFRVFDDDVWGGGAVVSVRLGMDGKVTVELSWPTTGYSIEDARKVIRQHQRAVAIAETIASHAAKEL